MPPPIDPQRDPPVRERVTVTPALAVEDFRSLRRWLVVLGVIAVLAAAVAAYALIKANESESKAVDEDRVVLLERSINRRSAEIDKRLARTATEIDNQERRLRRTGEESDVTKLDRRLRRVENDSADAVEAAADSGKELVQIERRLAALTREVERLK